VDKIITLLTNLLSLTKIAAVSVPGLLSNCAIAVMFLPPPPIDLIPIVKPNQIEVLQRRPRVAADVKRPPGLIQPACDIELISLKQALLGLNQVISPSEINEVQSQGHPGLAPRPFAKIVVDRRSIDDEPDSVQSQLLLDAEQMRLAECIEAETALKGLEKTENDQLASELAVLEKRSPTSKDIQRKRERILNNDQAIRDRDRDLASLGRFSGLIALRMADPGRLRPRQDFDSYLELLTHHVIAFILLSIALGVIVTAKNNALYSFLFRKLIGDL